MDYVTPTVDPIPHSPGVIGHGEGVNYKGQYFYYRVGKRLPKNQVASLMYEGRYCGRVQGDREWLVVIWDEGKGAFAVLTHVCVPGEVTRKMAPFRGKTPAECLEVIAQEVKEQQEWFDRQPKCLTCGGIALVFTDEQKDGECLTCCEKRLGKDKKRKRA